MAHGKAAAIVLAGGRSRRFGGGLDKTRLEVGGRALLDRVLAAVPAGVDIVVVGESRPTDRPVRWLADSRDGQGPAGATGDALVGLDPAVTRVLLLAADLPFLTVAACGQLLGQVEAGATGAVLVDPDGHEQWLAGAWQVVTLQAAALVPNGSLRAALDLPGVARIACPATDSEGMWFDCDTPAELQRARREASE